MHVENSIIKQKSIARYGTLPRGSVISNTSPSRNTEKKKLRGEGGEEYFKTSQEDRLGNRSLKVSVCLKGFAGIQRDNI